VSEEMNQLSRTEIQERIETVEKDIKLTKKRNNLVEEIKSKIRELRELDDTTQKDKTLLSVIKTILNKYLYINRGNPIQMEVYKEELERELANKK